MIRFSLVQKMGGSCTALAFALRRRTEFIAAMADYSMKCFDTGLQRCPFVAVYSILYDMNS